MATVIDAVGAVSADPIGVTADPIAVNASGVPVHKGRWGYHACDYPMFLEIKAFHKLVLCDLRATRRLKRWEAKLPHNRVRRHKDGTTELIMKPGCLGTDLRYYLWVLAEYRQARRPRAVDEVKVLELPKNWRERSDELKTFYGGG